MFWLEVNKEQFAQQGYVKINWETKMNLLAWPSQEAICSALAFWELVFPHLGRMKATKKNDQKK